MRCLLILILLTTYSSSYSQYTRYIIEFKDKKGTAVSLSSPNSFLSSESIARKKLFSIPIDSTDLPVSKVYLDSIATLADIKVLYTSKWLNLAIIQTTNQNSLNSINKFNFIKKQYPIANVAVKYTPPKMEEKVISGAFSVAVETPNENILSYGKSSNQITIHEGEFLHNKGFQGEGIKIALFDGGFYKYLNYSPFDSIRKKNKIKYTWDFIQNDANVNDDDPHGMNCLSIMAGNIPGLFVGTSPNATFYLFRTEDSRSEYPIEEAYWLIAAERADSIGIQIISSSLGYTTFDDGYFNHQYSDLDGMKTLVSKAASMAVSKGMIVTNSAGNEGNDPWKYISAPADGINVLAIGAINSNKQIASFSSFGPSADGRTKPDVISVGMNTQLVAADGSIGIGSGTSFSNPNIAGLIACLWQAFPEFSHLEIIEAIKKSSDQYTNPDNRKGYGIPNMRIAYIQLEHERALRNAKRILTESRIKAYPNPITNECNLAYKSSSNGYFQWQLMNIHGQVIRSAKEVVKKDEYYVFNIDRLEILPNGKYFIRYMDDQGNGTIQVIK
ncbi:MAG: hypothetical protein RLY11_780 [Bacteroidota bacterium]